MNRRIIIAVSCLLAACGWSAEVAAKTPTPRESAEDTYAHIWDQGLLITGTADEDLFRRAYKAMHDAPEAGEFNGFPVHDHQHPSVMDALVEIGDAYIADSPCPSDERHSYRVGRFDLFEFNSLPAMSFAFTCEGQPAEMRHQLTLMPADLGGDRFDYLLHVWTRGMVQPPEGAGNPLQ